MADRPTPVCHLTLTLNTPPESCRGSRCAAWSPAKSGGTLGTCGLVPAPCVPWSDPATNANEVTRA